MNRETLLAEILGELGAQNPGKVMQLMRHWPGGRLSLVHVNVLFLLEADGELPMRGLAEAMDVSQASATGIVDRMEQRELVERRRDETDRRVVRVAITDEGRRLIQGLAAQRRDHLALMLAELTDDELAAYLTGMRAMRRARERLHEQALDAPHGSAHHAPHGTTHDTGHGTPHDAPPDPDSGTPPGDSQEASR